MEWTPAYSVGIEEIDNQHRELFNRINGLVDAIRQHVCKYKISDVIAFLEEYIVHHFGNEEAYMARFGYPEFEAHKAQHDFFMKSFAELKKELLKLEGGTKPGSYELSVDTNKLVVDWILNHIATVDIRLGAFLKARL